MGEADVSSAIRTSALDKDMSSAVRSFSVIWSTVLVCSAKTIEVEVGSRMPREISREFQKSFIRGIS